MAGRPPKENAATSSLPAKFYAVAKGRVPGIYTDWDTAQLQIKGWKGPRFKKFSTKAEAEEFIRQGGRSVSTPKPANAKSTEFEDQGVDSDVDEDLITSIHPAKQAKREEATLQNLSPRNSNGIPRHRTLPTPTKTQAESQDNILRIYTDGSSLGNGKLGAVAGLGVFFGDGDSR